MTTKLAFFSALLFSISATAASYEIVGPCSATPVAQGEMNVAQGTTVGDFTKTILDQQKIPYKEAGAGFSSILSTPVGAASVEYLNASELRAYGWCYSVDGVEPSLMPGEYVLQGEETIRWWYAFSHLVKGEWVSYCEPAYTVGPGTLCPK
jgi:hypothetical protein